MLAPIIGTILAVLPLVIVVAATITKQRKFSDRSRISPFVHIDVRAPKSIRQPTLRWKAGGFVTAIKYGMAEIQWTDIVGYDGREPKALIHVRESERIAWGLKAWHPILGLDIQFEPQYDDCVMFHSYTSMFGGYDPVRFIGKYQGGSIDEAVLKLYWMEGYDKKLRMAINHISQEDMDKLGIHRVKIPSDQSYPYSVLIERAGMVPL